MAANERTALVLLAAGAAAALYFASTPAPVLNGKERVPTEVDPHLLRRDDQVDGALAITHLPSGDEMVADVYNGHVYWKAEGDDSAAKRWSVTYRLQRYLIDPGWDLGTYAGHTDHGHEDDHGIVIGVRVSPARLLFGSVAPDALIGSHDAGLGVSAYPAPEFFGPFWRHVGIGVGHVWPYDGETSANVAYVSISTRF